MSVRQAKKSEFILELRQQNKFGIVCYIFDPQPDYMKHHIDSVFKKNNKEREREIKIL